MTIPPIDPRISDEIAAGRGTRHARQMPDSKVNLTDVECSGARVLWTPRDVSQTNRDGTTPRD